MSPSRALRLRRGLHLVARWVGTALPLVLRIGATEAGAQEIPKERVGAAAQQKALVAEARKVPADAAPWEPELESASFAVGGRVMAGWRMRNRHRVDRPLDRSFGFFLAQARINTWSQLSKPMKLKLSFDLGDGVGGAGRGDFLVRDAWLRFRVSKKLVVMAGRMRRPFSRLEMEGAGKLPIRGRGVGNELLLEDEGWGDRALGVQLGGRLTKRLSWAAMVSSPDVDEDTTDFHLRANWDWKRWVSIGANVAQKVIRIELESGDRQTLGATAWGLDARFRLENLSLLIDGLVAQDIRFDEDDLARLNGPPIRSAVVAGYLSYEVALRGLWRLQPVVFHEWADLALGEGGSEVRRTVVGLNALYNGRALRIMPQIEWIVPSGGEAREEWDRRESYYVMFSSQL